MEKLLPQGHKLVDHRENKIVNLKEMMVQVETMHQSIEKVVKTPDVEEILVEEELWVEGMLT